MDRLKRKVLISMPWVASAMLGYSHEARCSTGTIALLSAIGCTFSTRDPSFGLLTGISSMIVYYVMKGVRITVDAVDRKLPITPGYMIVLFRDLIHLPGAFIIDEQVSVSVVNLKTLWEMFSSQAVICTGFTMAQFCSTFQINL